MQTIITLLLAWTAAAKVIHYSDVFLEEWKTFKLRYNKTYIHTEKEKVAMKVFARNKYDIAQHNQRYERGEETFRMGVNQFADMTVEQFARAMNGYRRTRDEELKPATFIHPANVKAAASVDWERTGAVTEVKSQRYCNSCWAFAATGALEGQHYRKDNRLVSLSEQNLIDCTYADRKFNTCKHGDTLEAFAYVNFNDGIDTENTYPYEAVPNLCRYNRTNSGAEDVGLVVIESGNEGDLMMAVATLGPVAAGIDANHKSFMLYDSGVYYERRCSSTYLNHAVLVVGYGSTKRVKRKEQLEYWRVKNSYGQSWGERGYIRMARDQRNNCGIASQASLPLV